jgi:hypothetical protein
VFLSCFPNDVNVLLKALLKALAFFAVAIRVEIIAWDFNFCPSLKPALQANARSIRQEVTSARAGRVTVELAASQPDLRLARSEDVDIAGGHACTETTSTAIHFKLVVSPKKIVGGTCYGGGSRGSASTDCFIA